MPLDLGRLVGAKTGGGRTTAQCPVCASHDADQHGKNHLIIYPSGKWGCCVDQSPEHSRAIWALLGDGTDGVMTDLAPAPPEPTVEMERTWPASTLVGLIRDHSYWEGRGIPAEVLDPLQGGMATRAQMANRHVLPIFNSNGEIHGFAGRATKPSMQIRWKHIGKVSSWVWGDLDGIEETGRAILVEGPGDRLALDARHVPGALVLWGVNLSQAVLAHLIAANPRDIVVATNNDVKAHAAGQRAAAKILGVLNRFFDEGVVRVCLPGPKDLLDQHVAGDEAWAEWMARLDPAAEVALDSAEGTGGLEESDTDI